MADSNCTCTNLATVKVSKLPLAVSSSFYNFNDQQEVSSINELFENNSNLILSHYYYNPDEDTYYYKSEKTTIKDISDYIIYKYDQIYRYKNYTGSFTGYFNHTSTDENEKDNLYGNFNGTASGYFNGFGNLYNSSITSSIITESSIDDKTILTGSLNHKVRGTFTGSIYNETEGTWDNQTGLNDKVTFYGKSQYAVTASYALNAYNSKYSETASYVNISHADTADTSAFAHTADVANSVRNATNADYSSHSIESDLAMTSSHALYSVKSAFADNSKNAIYAKYAENVAHDDYPVGYSEYVKVTPGNGTNICEDSEFDGTNFKWIKFKCKSNGVYTLTYNYTALRLTKLGSVGQVLPIPNQDIYYRSGALNVWNSQAMYLTVYKINDSNEKEQTCISATNTYNTVIQFPCGDQSADQYCPETVQCINIVYDIKLLKDTTYIVVLNYNPFRKDCVVDTPGDPCKGEYFCGLYYKISPLNLKRQGLIYNTITDNRNQDHLVASGFDGYVNPVLEIRKVKEWDGNSVTENNS